MRRLEAPGTSLGPPGPLPPLIPRSCYHPAREREKKRKRKKEKQLVEPMIMRQLDSRVTFVLRWPGFYHVFKTASGPSGTDRRFSHAPLWGRDVYVCSRPGRSEGRATRCGLCSPAGDSYELQRGKKCTTSDKEFNNEKLVRKYKIFV